MKQGTSVKTNVFRRVFTAHQPSRSAMILEAHKHSPCDVFDANGQPLLYAVWADTETGEAVHLVKENGEFLTTVSEDGEETCLRVWRQHPAPLTYVMHRAR